MGKRKGVKTKVRRSIKRKKVGISLELTRGYRNDRQAFEACAAIGGEGAGWMDRRALCATGKNPRVAIGTALARLGAQIKRQKGAFRGSR